MAGMAWYSQTRTEQTPDGENILGFYSDKAIIATISEGEHKEEKTLREGATFVASFF